MANMLLLLLHDELLQTYKLQTLEYGKYAVTALENVKKSKGGSKGVKKSGSAWKNTRRIHLLRARSKTTFTIRVGTRKAETWLTCLYRPRKGKEKPGK